MLHPHPSSPDVAQLRSVVATVSYLAQGGLNPLGAAFLLPHPPRTWPLQQRDIMMSILASYTTKTSQEIWTYLGVQFSIIKSYRKLRTKLLDEQCVLHSAMCSSLKGKSSFLYETLSLGKHISMSKNSIFAKGRTLIIFLVSWIRWALSMKMEQDEGLMWKRRSCFFLASRFWNSKPNWMCSRMIGKKSPLL